MKTRIRFAKACGFVAARVLPGKESTSSRPRRGRVRPEVRRVIFISSPHRGSETASSLLGRFGASLVKAPTLLGADSEAAKAMVTLGDSLKLNRIPNSVDTLAPNNRFVVSINTIPLTPGIRYHSIMGDRGNGGNKDHTRPVSSEGVVPYWSSHLEGAQSELIVPSRPQCPPKSQGRRRGASHPPTSSDD